MTEGDGDTPRKSSRRAVIAAGIVAAALAVWWYCIPLMNRPGDALFIMLAVLGIFVAAVSGNRVLQGVGLVMLTLGGTLFGLELAQKRFDLVDLATRFRRPQAASAAKASGFNFDRDDAESYLAARKYALEHGVPEETLRLTFAGDIFAGEDKSTLLVRRKREGGRIDTRVSRKVSPFMSDNILGIEFRPDFVWRFYCTAEKDGTMLCDGAARTDAHGFRKTGGDPDATDTYVFMGCSVTFGDWLDDADTLPEQFSRLFGHKARVLNAGISGNGPHHSLRDLELNRRLGRAGVKPDSVRAVYFSYIADHARRVLSRTPTGSPRYELENGKAVYKGTVGDVDALGRWKMLLFRTRLYPALFERMADGSRPGDKDLAMAILDGMHRICRERYGVPLTVVDWAGERDFADGMRARGMTVIPVTDILGADWMERMVLFGVADTHPNANANRLIAEYLHNRAAAQGKSERQTTN